MDALDFLSLLVVWRIEVPLIPWQRRRYRLVGSCVRHDRVASGNGQEAPVRLLHGTCLVETPFAKSVSDRIRIRREL